MALKEPQTSAAPTQSHRQGGPWPLRRREWVLLGASFLGLALLFSLWPGLDFTVSSFFYQTPVPSTGTSVGKFVGNEFVVIGWIHEAVPWFGRASVLLGLLLLVRKIRSGLLGLRRWRRWLALGLLMLLGNGLVVNSLLKEGWGRARPVDVQAFGGPASFSPALLASSQCESNCSFVSGHAATGFGLLAVGMLGSAATRRRWLKVGLLAGLAVGLIRIAQGGHFLSDVLFSGWVMWLCSALLREAWLRLRLRRWPARAHQSSSRA